MSSQNILKLLFVSFGIYAIINPAGISLIETEKSYDVTDLIRGWGIYSVTIAALLSFPTKTRIILFWCFLFSIIWHILIANRKGWTAHHRHSIIMNSIAILCLWHFNSEKELNKNER